LEEGGRSCSSWWREVGRIREGVGDVGGRWFGNNVVRKVGDGNDTLFWSHRWLGGSALSERFPRLYELAENKTVTVASMFSLGIGQDGDGWRWRRRLWVWEENLLDECMAFLLDVSLVPNVSDVWVWIPNPVGGYSVRGAYDFLTSADTHLHSALDLVWHHQVPLKVSIFAWRLLRNRLPTKSNLVAKGIIHTWTDLCVAGCGQVETADHLFTSCFAFVSLWQQVRHWIGFVGADINIVADHLVQYTHMTGGGKAKRSFMQLIWLLTTWVVWNERNNRLFNNVITDVPRLLDKIKSLSLAWLLAKKAVFVFGTQRWWSSPLACLGFG
jgi:hypothetical protein